MLMQSGFLPSKILRVSKLLLLEERLLAQSSLCSAKSATEAVYNQKGGVLAEGGLQQSRAFSKFLNGSEILVAMTKTCSGENPEMLEQFWHVFSRAASATLQHGGDHGSPVPHENDRKGFPKGERVPDRCRQLHFFIDKRFI